MTDSFLNTNQANSKNREMSARIDLFQFNPNKKVKSDLRNLIISAYTKFRLSSLISCHSGMLLLTTTSQQQHLTKLCRLTQRILQTQSFRRIRNLSVSSSKESFIGTQLKSRSLIHLYGVDTFPFLQGLITNDIQHLTHTPAIFALILNHQGRILYDVILYNSNQAIPSNNLVDNNDDKFKEQPNLLLECDSRIQTQLIKHLTLYRLKKKVQIKGIDDQLSIWSVIDPQLLTGEIQLKDRDAILSEVCTGTTPTPSAIDSLSPLAAECPYKLELSDTNLKPISDPRLGFLGWRIITNLNTTLKSKTNERSIGIGESEIEYKKSLYALGIGEGLDDLPTANCFPLECNGDLLHGINFHKGCYVGQELTARTHHTGVIRKRLMPFSLPAGVTIPSETDQTKLEIVNPKSKRPVGKVRAVIDNIGLGLIRVEDALGAPELKLNDHPVTVRRPFWWPKIETSSQEKIKSN